MRRMLIVDADIEMWPVVDQAWKRPCVSADTGADAFKIEHVAPLEELARALRVDRYINHHGAPDAIFDLTEHRRAHPASGTIGADQHWSFEGRPLGPHPHRAIGLLNLPDPALIDDL